MREAIHVAEAYEVEAVLPFQTATLTAISSVRQLATLLDVDYARELSFILYRMPASQRYRTFEIGRRGGGTRTIDAPRPLLKKIQHRLLPFLQALYVAPPCAHGNITGRSIKTNAQEHTGRRYLVNIDIKDFFPSIHFKRVENILKSSRYGISEPVARAIAQIACHNGRLPMGAPTSGVLSNIVCAPLDAALMRHAKLYNVRYTRYVDDITLSTSSRSAFASGIAVPPDKELILRDLAHLSTDLVTIVNGAGFALNPKKVWIVGPRARHSVTGLVTNRKVNVPKEFFSELRGALHAIDAYGLSAATTRFGEIKKPGWSTNIVKNVAGRLAYLGQVTSFGLKYTRIAKRARALISSSRIYLPATDVALAVYQLSTLIDEHEGTAFHVGKGLFLTAAHVFPTNIEMGFARLHRPGDALFTTACVGIDYDLDIALLRAAKPSAFDSAPSIKMKIRAPLPGDQLLTIGFPQYSPGNSHSEIAVRVTGTRMTFGVERIECDRPFPHGASGGPVVDQHGYGVGVVHSGPALGSEDAPLGTTFTPYSTFKASLAGWEKELA